MAYAQPLTGVNRVVFLGASILNRMLNNPRNTAGVVAVENYLSGQLGYSVSVLDEANSGDNLTEITTHWDSVKSSYAGDGNTIVLLHALGNTISQTGNWGGLSATKQGEIQAEYHALIDNIEANGNIVAPINTSFREYDSTSLLSDMDPDASGSGSYPYNENVLKPALAGLAVPMGDATTPFFDIYNVTRNHYTALYDGIHPDNDLQGMLLAYLAESTLRRIQGEDPITFSRIADPSLDHARRPNKILAVTGAGGSPNSVIGANYPSHSINNALFNFFDTRKYERLNSVTITQDTPVGTSSDNGTALDNGDFSQSVTNDRIKQYGLYIPYSRGAEIVFSASGYNPNQSVQIEISSYKDSTASDRISEFSTTATFDSSIKIDGSSNVSSADPEATMNVGTLDAQADANGDLTLYWKAAEGSSFGYFNAAAVSPIFPPTVDAGPNITADNGDTVTLSGATASNYDSLLWTCTSGQSPTFSDATVLNPTVTFNEAGVHTLQLTATNTEDSVSDTVEYDVTSATVVTGVFKATPVR